MKTIVTKPSANFTVPPDPEKDISGIWLVDMGWRRNGSGYVKGNDIVKYDGVNWTLNGKKVFKIKDFTY